MHLSTNMQIVYIPICEIITACKWSLGQGNISQFLLFTGGGVGWWCVCLCVRGVRLWVWMGREGVWLWVQWGICLWVCRGVHPREHTHPLDTPRTHTSSWTPSEGPLTVEMAIEAGDTHPTGMHSCYSELVLHPKFQNLRAEWYHITE